MEIGTRRMLGELLLERGVLSRAQLRVGLVHHHEARVPLGRALVREGICTEADVLHALSSQLGISPIALEHERARSAGCARPTQEICVLPSGAFLPGNRTARSGRKSCPR